MARQGLSRKQKQILDYIKDAVRTRGYPPSVREIGESVGLRSSSTVHGHLLRLEEKGFIRRDPTKPRAIELLDPSGMRRPAVDVPLVGQITAGAPILAVENIEEFFPIPDEFARGHEVFLLKVKGDSMVGAGILDGDYVVIRQQASASNGDIVAALLGDEATIKTFYRDANGIRLQPENERYEPIISLDVQVLGKVVGLFRRLD
ncbi:MAG: transcriptional repressor LexA [Bacillota bacterium]